MPITNRTRRRMLRVHKRLVKMHNALYGIMEQIADVEDDKDLDEVAYYLGNAQLNLYYASRVFEDGNCELLDKWKKKQGGEK